MVPAWRNLEKQPRCFKIQPVGDRFRPGNPDPGFPAMLKGKGKVLPLTFRVAHSDLLTDLTPEPNASPVRRRDDISQFLFYSAKREIH